MPKWMKMFDGRLDVEPPLSQEQLGKIPARRGVLCLLAAADEPILLTTAADIRARLRGRLAARQDDQRTRTADLRAVTRRILWKRATSHFEMDLLFLDRARTIWPDTYTSLLAWKPAWFVGVDFSEAYPYFTRTREVSWIDVERHDPHCRYFGPFPNGRWAQQFVESLQDAMDLCRHVKCLRLSPNGKRCAYAQIGKCLSPCDGTVSTDEYRSAVLEAAELAAGRREGLIGRLHEQMNRAADALEFEKAASIKTKLSRLADFDNKAFEFVAPAEQFRFILVQRADSTRRAKVFLVNIAGIVPAGVLDYPLKDAQLRRVLDRMAKVVGKPSRACADARWPIGLVTHYLFAAGPKRGAVVRWHDQLTPANLAAGIERASDCLGLGSRAGRDDKPAAPASPSCDPGGYDDGDCQGDSVTE